MISSAIPWVLAAAASNVIAVWFLKPSKGMMVPLPTLMVLGSIALCHYFLALAVSHRGSVGLTGAVALNVVLVTTITGIIGFVQGDRLGFWQIVGYTLAIAGVALALATGTPADGVGPEA